MRVVGFQSVTEDRLDARLGEIEIQPRDERELRAAVMGGG